MRPAAEAIRRLRAFATAAALTATLSGGLLAQTGAAPSYHIIRSIPLGGSGRWDYITLDSVKHRLFIARQTRVMVVDPESGKLLGEIPGLRRLGPDDPDEHGGVISFVLDGIHPHDVATVFDAEGVAVRAGHHCAQPLMIRYDLPATTRASFYVYNDHEDVERLVAAIRATQALFASPT